MAHRSILWRFLQCLDRLVERRVRVMEAYRREIAVLERDGRDASAVRSSLGYLEDAQLFCLATRNGVAARLENGGIGRRATD